MQAGAGWLGWGKLRDWVVDTMDCAGRDSWCGGGGSKSQQGSMNTPVHGLSPSRKRKSDTWASLGCTSDLLLTHIQRVQSTRPMAA